MSRILNFILQGKGGVGKSLVAALMAQYFRAVLAGCLVCVDTDPVNATFAGYKAFDTRRLELLDNGVVDSGRFDNLMLQMLTEDADFIVDNGASCFIPLTKYLFESDAFSVLRDAGREVRLHTVITGGYGLKDTVAGFDSLASMVPPEVKLYVWINEYFGEVEVGAKKFEDMRAYVKHRDHVAAILRLPKLGEQTFGRDLKTVLDRRLTFDEALASDEFHTMSKSRIRKIKKQMFDEMTRLG